MSSKIVLASRSPSRIELLESAGIVFSSRSHMINEHKEKQNISSNKKNPKEFVREIAIKKAVSISHKLENDLVIGSDQILYFNGMVFSKPRSRQELIEQISLFQGQDHKLYSSACALKGNKLMWSYTSSAVMSMRYLSPSNIERYVKSNWNEVKNSVGGYHIERQGIKLFSSIKGDYFTVRGIPLMELINFLISTKTINL